MRHEWLGVLFMENVYICSPGFELLMGKLFQRGGLPLNSKQELDVFHIF